jgi:hypothetical protein
MSNVIARFYVAKVEKFAYGGPGTVSQRSVTLQVATRGEENKTWAQATPSGQITMHINNGAAGEWFEEMLGHDVAVTFSVAEDPLPPPRPTQY